MAQPPWSPDQPDEEPDSVVRPYTITRGRTRPARQEIEFETLVWTTSTAAFSPPPANAHWRAVADLCREVVSLVEIAAHLKLPIGVARVLVGDMAEAGLLSLQRPQVVGEAVEIALLEKVLDGLHRL
jgi:hypothetical protein